MVGWFHFICLRKNFTSTADKERWRLLFPVSIVNCGLFQCRPILSVLLDSQTDRQTHRHRHPLLVVRLSAHVLICIACFANPTFRVACSLVLY